MTKELFQQIGEFQYATEAFIYKGKLESDGIEVFIRDHYTINADPLLSKAIGGVKLFVRKEDYENALEILSKISSFSVDDRGDLLSCPNCGAKEVMMVNSIKDFKSLMAFLFSFLFLTLPIFTRFKYKCQSCQTEFD